MRFLHLPQRRHTVTQGTPEHRTAEHGTPAEQRNTPEKWRTTEHPETPTEHPGIPTEQQRNTSGTPRNNETIQNEKKLQCFLKKI